jgi:hypothetical protein
MGSDPEWSYPVKQPERSQRPAASGRPLNDSLLRAVFGDEAGIGGRATVGITGLARNHCFETWLSVEVRA